MPQKPGLSHDGYFKRHLTRRELAVSFFQNYLPREILKRMRWDTLRLASGDFVGKALRNRRSDIVYEVLLKDRKCLLYIHLEHQRTVDKWMAFRVLGYVHAIWDQYLSQHPKATETLPLVYPMIIYQGTERWYAPQSLHELLEVPEYFKAYCPELRYDLMDLSRFSDGEIKAELLKNSALTLFLLLMKHIDSPEINDLLSGRLLPLIRELVRDKGGLEYIRDMLYYLASKGSHLDEEKVIAELSNIPQTEEAEEYIMTLIETWQQRGYEKGISAGIEQGIEKGISVGIEQGIEKGRKTSRIELVADLLKSKFSTQADTWIEKLDDLTTDQLKTVAERLLFSDNLAEIFDGLIH